MYAVLSRKITIEVEVPSSSPPAHPKARIHAFLVRGPQLTYGGHVFTELDKAADWWARHPGTTLYAFGRTNPPGAGFRAWEAEWLPAQQGWSEWKENTPDED